MASSPPDGLSSTRTSQLGMSAPALLSSKEIKKSAQSASSPAPQPLQRHVTDLTAGNRRGDIRNAGGHLGPQSNDNNSSIMDANLGNLTLQYTPCRSGDMILLMSDGIHDNFDPEALGKDPSHFGVQVDSWDRVPIEDYVLIKDSFRKTQLEKHIRTSISPKDTVQTIFNFIETLTEPTRKFMEGNQGKEEPKDYKKFPGKSASLARYPSPLLLLYSVAVQCLTVLFPFRATVDHSTMISFIVP
jgi:hypothetical protein